MREIFITNGQTGGDNSSHWKPPISLADYSRDSRLLGHKGFSIFHNEIFESEQRGRVLRGWRLAAPTTIGVLMQMLKRALLVTLWFVTLGLSQVVYSAQFAYVTNYLGDTVSVIDTAANAMVATVPVGAGPSVLAVNPAGTFVYVGHRKPLLVGAGQVSVIDTATNAVVATVPGLGWCYQIAVNPAGTFVYVLNGTPVFGNQTVVSVIDTSTNTVVATIPVDFGGGIAVNPVRPRAYFATGQSVVAMDTITNTVIAAVTVTSGNGASALAVHPAGTFVYVTDSANNKVSVIDTATNAVVAIVPVGATPRAVAVNPAGTVAYVMNWEGNSISAINTATNTVAATVPLGNYPESIAMNPAGTSLYVLFLNPDGILGTKALKVIDTATNAIVASLPFGPGSGSIAFKPDGTAVYFVDSGANRVSVVSSATRTVIANVPVGSSPEHMVVGPVVSSPASVSAMPIPTLSQWLLIVTGLLLAGFGARRLPGA